MGFRDAIDGVSTGTVTKIPDPPPQSTDKARQWGEVLKSLRGGAPGEEPEPSKTTGEEIKPGPAPREEVHPQEELRRVS
ncbi:hypothetical protein [Inquilinus limosus]|uniref:Uncharacterized protein n=1 Tax=Inquilinus limosus TaxID=171674 RepID=A0A211ZMM1_9PROT|nr:hypothetical protein [Inquilinus limosus]OWJ66525.1 hypothetical protein BWR60_14410 [Inquilinus limosus]